jgi:hypothetical protein
MKTLINENGSSESLQSSDDAKLYEGYERLFSGDTAVEKRPLTVEEQTDLAMCINKLHKSFITAKEVLEALTPIRDKQLYRDKFDTFQEYFEIKLRQSKAYCLLILRQRAEWKKRGKSPTETVVIPGTEAQEQPLVKPEYYETKFEHSKTYHLALFYLRAAQNKRGKSPTEPVATPGTEAQVHLDPDVQTQAKQEVPDRQPMDPNTNQLKQAGEEPSQS